MAVFLMDAAPITDAERDAALRLAARRFPELALEQRFGEHDGSGDDLWVCRAPDPDRLARWAAAAGLEVGDIRHVESLDLQTTKTPARTNSKEQP